MKLSFQDIGAIGSVLALLWGAFVGIKKFFLKKFFIKKADIRANFFKCNKSWKIRIYNASSEELEAIDIRVYFPEEDNYSVNWDSENDSFPSLKKHASFDITVLLYTTSPDYTTIRIEWKQPKSKKIFTCSETLSLR
jgi:hypothetical protein